MKPILFSTPMVQALLERRKRQTRRTNGLAGLENHELARLVWGGDGKQYAIFIKDGIEKTVKFPYAVGDILYVRETTKVGAWNDEDHKMAFDYRASPELKKTPWVEFEDIERFNDLHLKVIEELAKLNIEPIIDEENERFYYKWEPGSSPLKWKPSLFMPKEAARIFPKITNIRIERLQDISEVDAIAEGIKPLDYWRDRHYPGHYFNYLNDGRGPQTPRFSFFTLWESINGQESLASNPWVWVYDFEVSFK